VGLNPTQSVFNPSRLDDFSLDFKYPTTCIQIIILSLTNSNYKQGIQI
jgi:hypothetical protein